MKRGFTLIEMIVSIAIITSVTTLFLANYRSANKRTDLVMTAQTIVADLHYAQSNTLGLAKYNNIVPAGGWGISFDKAAGAYTLFADLDAPGTPGYRQFDPATEGNTAYGARRVELPAAIKIEKLATANNSAYTLANATFLPPDPRTNIWLNTGATSTSLQIILVEDETAKSKTINVNFLGLAEVTE